MRTAALIPAHDAAAALGTVVRSVRCHLPHVLVVDDGSDDDTARVAEEAGARVLRHPKNSGKGTAIQTGLQDLAEHGFGRVVVLDADGQHLPDEIPKLMAKSDRNLGALVLGVREKTEQPIATANRLANWAADLAMGFVTGRRFRDSQCGFRVYPIAETLALGAHGARMEFETEVLILACRVGMPVREVVTCVYYPPVDERQSGYRPLEDTVRIGWAMIRALVS